MMIEQCFQTRFGKGPPVTNSIKQRAHVGFTEMECLLCHVQREGVIDFIMLALTGMSGPNVMQTWLILQLDDDSDLCQLVGVLPHYHCWWLPQKQFPQCEIKSMTTNDKVFALLVTLII